MFLIDRVLLQNLNNKKQHSKPQLLQLYITVLISLYNGYTFYMRPIAQCDIYFQEPLNNVNRSLSFPFDSYRNYVQCTIISVYHTRLNIARSTFISLVCLDTTFTG